MYRAGSPESVPQRLATIDLREGCLAVWVILPPGCARTVSGEFGGDQPGRDGTHLPRAGRCQPVEGPVLGYGFQSGHSLLDDDAMFSETKATKAATEKILATSSTPSL